MGTICGGGKKKRPRGLGKSPQQIHGRTVQENINGRIEIVDTWKLAVKFTRNRILDVGRKPSQMKDT